MKRLSKSLTDQFVESYQAGETILSIAERLGVGQGSVWRTLRASGVKPRPHGLRKATIHVPEDPSTLAYIAGLFDGEGNLQLKQDGKRCSVGGKLHIYSTHQGVIEWLADTVGGSVRWDHKRVEQHGWKPMGIWGVVRARDISLLLRALLPFLIIKREVAETVLALYDTEFGDRHQATPVLPGI